MQKTFAFLIIVILAVIVFFLLLHLLYQLKKKVDEKKTTSSSLTSTLVGGGGGENKANILQLLKKKKKKKKRGLTYVIPAALDEIDLETKQFTPLLVDQEYTSNHYIKSLVSKELDIGLFGEKIKVMLKKRVKHAGITIISDMFHFRYALDNQIKPLYFEPCLFTLPRNHYAIVLPLRESDAEYILLTEEEVDMKVGTSKKQKKNKNKKKRRRKKKNNATTTKGRKKKKEEEEEEEEDAEENTDDDDNVFPEDVVVEEDEEEEEEEEEVQEEEEVEKPIVSKTRTVIPASSVCVLEREKNSTTKLKVSGAEFIVMFAHSFCAHDIFV